MDTKSKVDASLVETKTQQVNKEEKRKGYTYNPWIKDLTVPVKVKKQNSLGKNTNLSMIDNETGELIPVGFWITKKADKEKFVKIYLKGVQALLKLSKAGLKVFEILYKEVQNTVNKDLVYLNYSVLKKDNKTNLSKTMFYNGLNDLIDKGFIAPKTNSGWYFINPQYMWNGDRLFFIKRLIKTFKENQEKIEEESTQEEQEFLLLIEKLSRIYL